MINSIISMSQSKEVQIVASKKWPKLILQKGQPKEDHDEENKEPWFSMITMQISPATRSESHNLSANRTKHL